jgi:WD40 repeat protein
VPGVFISYSRSDKEFVARLHDALVERQYEVWIDWEDIPPSAEWFEEIRAGVDRADAFVYVISPESVDSKVCAQELGHAVAEHKRIIPVVRRDPDAAKVPAEAAALNWIFVRDQDDFDAGVEQLVSAVEQDLEHVHTHTRLGVAANRWEAGGHEPSQLLRGAELTAAEAWLVAGADKQPEATQLQRRYVLASRQGATRRQRLLIGGVTFALVVTAVLAVVAVIQRATAIHERNVAFARQLDANAQGQYAKDPELSVLLAVRAAQVDPGTATEAALREALAQSHVRTRYRLMPPPEPGDALWSPDGMRLLVTSPRFWARIYAPGSNAAPVALSSPPASNGQSAWDARGDRVVIGGGRPAVYDSATGRLVAQIPGTALFSALTSDGARVVTVDVHSVGHVFDVASGRQLASFHPGYRAGTTCLALSPDDSVVAQCDAQSLGAQSAPGALDTWDAHTGQLLHSVASPSLIQTVAFSPDSRRYVFTTPVDLKVRRGTSAASLARAGGLDGTLVYDTRSGERVIAFPGAASAATFSPIVSIPELAYATTSDALGHVYSFLSGVNRPLTGNADRIDTLRFNHTGTEVVAGGADDTARVYDALTGGLAVEVLAGHLGPLVGASFGLDDTAIATASDDGTVRVWASPKPKPSVTLPATQLPPGAGALAATSGFTADSRRIVSASLNGQGEVLDAHGAAVLAHFAAPSGQGFAGAIASRDGRVVAALSGPLNGKGVIDHATVADLYDAGTGRLIATVAPGTGGPLLNGALNHSGDTLVTVGANGASDEYDARTGRLLHHLPGSTPAGAAAFSQDGSQLAIVHYPTLPRAVTFATTFGPITIDLYNGRTGRHLRTIVGDTLTPQEPATSLYAPLTVAFSPAGARLAVSGADQGVELYAPQTGAGVKRLGIAGASGGSFVASLAFSPDGRLLAAGSVSGAYVWRLPAFAPLPVFQHIPAGSAPPFIGSGFGVSVGFTMDSRYLATSGDSALTAWDPTDHLQLFRADLVTRGAMNPGGTELVTVGLGGAALYPCDLCGGLSHLLEVAKRNTTRQLTPSEKATYLTQG